MPHLRFGAALFVCASIYAQQTPSLQGVIHHRLESATVLALSAVAADAKNTDAGTRHFNVAAIEPEAVSFTEFEDGRYVAVMSIDASSLRAARIHFQSLQLPEGAELYLYSERGRGEAPPFAVGPYTNVGPLDGSDFWSDALPGGQSIIVELQVRGEIPSALPFQIDLVEELES
ncbi:MAG TPA: hypothetical protein VER03_04350, partial [Bryobacteraceae bacterium]|nr:hypothetical protein [Bryobacteraceae bacterium]